jgi:hypothetical protein
VGRIVSPQLVHVVCEYLTTSDGLKEVRLVGVKAGKHLPCLLQPSFLGSAQHVEDGFRRDGEGVEIVGEQVEQAEVGWVGADGGPFGGIVVYLLLILPQQLLPFLRVLFVVVARA